MYPTYVLTDRADKDFLILSASGLTVMLLTFASGTSSMAGRIHLLSAASILLASLMGSRFTSGGPVEIHLRLVSERSLTENYSVEALLRVCPGTLDNFPRHAPYFW